MNCESSEPDLIPSPTLGGRDEDRRIDVEEVSGRLPESSAVHVGDVHATIRVAVRV